MAFTVENIIFLGSVLIFVSILISKTGYRFGVPTLLLFLFTGMAFGSEGLGIAFNQVADAQFIGMLSLSVILFTGGMDTKMHDVHPILAPGVLLASLGVVLTTALTGLFVFFLSRATGLDIHLSLVLSMLLAATMSSTDSASVFNLLRTQGIGLKHRLRPILELESGSNDPMAYMLTLALVEVAATGAEFSTLHLLGNLLVQFFLGGLLGWGLGRVCSWVVNRINLPNPSLYPVLLLSFILIIYTFTDMFHGNGYLAVYVAGLVVGNRRLSYRREMTTFMDGLTWLLQIVMFLTLGLLVNPSEVWQIAYIGLAIGLFMMLVSRPLSVFICLLPFRRLPVRAKLFLSWVGLRGAVPIIFATYPMMAGLEDGNLLFNIVFFITLLSLSLQGTTISWAARRLGLDCEQEKPASEFGIEIPEELGPQLNEQAVTPELLVRGEHLADVGFPEGHLVMLVKRGDSFIVPNGQLKLHVGDVLLTISK
mgnify:CR=1 FL=1